MTYVAPRRLLTHRRYPSTDRTSAARRAGRTRRIVLTGGPGSGKSTAAAFLAREFVDELWVLPESATLLYRGGLPRAAGPAGQEVAQRAIFTVQRALEDASLLQHPDRVQLCDRATVDGAAYWPAGAEGFFHAMGTTRELEFDRYDAVVFMHTAARLPAGYERDLDIRTEDRDEAVELDRRMFELYSAHPRMIAVESSASFLDKLTAVRNAVLHLLHDGDREAAPLSSLMGLASVQHVLPVD